MMMMITGVSENLCWSTFPTIDALVSLKLMKQNVIIMVMMIEVMVVMMIMITMIFFHDEDDSVILLIQFN